MKAIVCKKMGRQMCFNIRRVFTKAPEAYKFEK